MDSGLEDREDWHGEYPYPNRFALSQGSTNITGSWVLAHTETRLCRRELQTQRAVCASTRLRGKDQAPRQLANAADQTVKAGEREACRHCPDLSPPPCHSHGQSPPAPAAQLASRRASCAGCRTPRSPHRTQAGASPGPVPTHSPCPPTPAAWPRVSLNDRRGGPIIFWSMNHAVSDTTTRGFQFQV